ncbi:ABC transporter substrate-binding protein [Fulvivirga sp. 29W222]|uniref:ABC transporter substrate-binding protein n=1 Tax=Fulvivirga marina TaxID=2494733 RepID=A0A937KDQ5_9BACT|nr:ABC transporter substrate-binding protein [Fulvivirga marina]MBL6449371.1 ABC transporter substrate-binding protein [Fulvivirga marina]
MLEKKESQKSIKVGVLMPQSTEYPKARINFVNGIKLYFTLFENKFQRGKVELIIEDIGFGTNTLVNEKAHKLLVEDQVNLIVGHMGSSTAVELAQMLSQVEIPVLISNLGEGAIKTDSIPENLYFNTFQFWQSYFHLGQYLASNFKRDWILISSLYDSGYDPLRAFRVGLQTNGAHINNEIYLNAHEVGDLIIEFKSRIKSLEGLTPALFLPPSLLNQFVDTLDSSIDEMVITPFYNHDNPANKYWAFPGGTLTPSDPSFINGVQEYLDTTPDLFHVLGYRSGAMVYEAAQKLNAPKDDSINILNAWKGFTFQLGDEFFSVDQYTHELMGNIKIFKGQSSTKQSEVCSTVDANDIPKEIIEEMTMTKAAFTNPYMFY